MARLLTDTIIGGGSIFSFGASHSFMITEEMVYRTGGLMLVNPIYPHGMNLGVRPGDVDLAVGARRRVGTRVARPFSRQGR